MSYHQGWKRYDAMGGMYCRLRDKHPSPGRELLRSAVLELVRQDGHIMRGATLIDVGCGDGLDLEYYRSKFSSLHTLGVEPSACMANLARGRMPDRPVMIAEWGNLNPQRMNLYGNRVRYVTACFSLHHASNLACAVSDVHELLEVGGYFCFVVPHPSFLDGTVVQRGDKEVIEAPIFGGQLSVEYPRHRSCDWEEAIPLGYSKRDVINLHFSAANHALVRTCIHNSSRAGWQLVRNVTFSMSGDENGEKDGWFVVLKKAG